MTTDAIGPLGATVEDVALNWIVDWLKPALTAAKNVVEHLDRALELKYADRAQLLRLKAGKDTGAAMNSIARIAHKKPRFATKKCLDPMIPLFPEPGAAPLTPSPGSRVSR